MSEVIEHIPADHVSHAGRQPGALAILAATALGGVIGTRLGKVPLALVAGAAAVAWLNPKKVSEGQTISPLPPELVPVPKPELEPAQTPIDQWLARQMDRDAQSAVVALPVAQEMTEAWDDYIPQPLLIDDMDDVGPATPQYETFVHLTKPSCAKPKPLKSSLGPCLGHPIVQSLVATESAPSGGAAWLLGVEPLPSLGDAVAEPLWSSVPESPSMLTLPVFEGGISDEVEAQIPLPPLVHLMPVLPSTVASTAQRPPVPEPEDEAVLEIPVLLASPGEASFDPPMAAISRNPWEAEPLQPVDPVLVAPPATGPVIEAEIVLRPRLAALSTVVPRDQPVSPRFAKTNAAAGLPVVASSLSDHSAPQSVSEPPHSKVWRSWWGGD